jgi:large-conductance mechanosensitive channel
VEREHSRQSFVFAAVGIVIGAALALVVSKLFSSVLVIVDTFDAVGYA